MTQCGDGVDNGLINSVRDWPSPAITSNRLLTLLPLTRARCSAGRHISFTLSLHASVLPSLLSHLYPLFLLQLWCFSSFLLDFPRVPDRNSTCGHVLKHNQQRLSFFRRPRGIIEVLITFCPGRFFFFYGGQLRLEWSLVIYCQWRMKLCEVRHVQGQLWTPAASGRLRHTYRFKAP